MTTYEVHECASGVRGKYLGTVDFMEPLGAIEFIRMALACKKCHKLFGGL